MCLRLAYMYMYLKVSIVLDTGDDIILYTGISLSVTFTMGVLDYHTEDLLRREDCILSTRFARMDPT